MSIMHSSVDIFLANSKKWQAEMEQLRIIVLDCGLTEDFKWRSPCYSYQKGNVVIIQGFKEYCGLMFFKGALLQDSDGVLTKPGEQTQSGRLIRFTSADQIVSMTLLLKNYIYEAIEVEKSGLKVAFKKSTELVLAEELQNKLTDDSNFKLAFQALTPGRQRAYNLYFSEAKQSKTRESRIEKCYQQILEGRGLNECTCGLSKKYPYCDGSHKTLSGTLK